ncbi:hypothetical protein NITHO_4580003 [Nitrolancea hollandica Lb]|uniref:Uncharacterized protein n=1 Tax=Nitrolancea hollandica Lb TaxID=1129897 RepID=I4EKE9_9BACT|nr:hypothetical protein NITHO_4580003 [Nitrolancea hollandica Lb]
MILNVGIQFVVIRRTDGPTNRLGIPSTLASLLTLLHVCLDYLDILFRSSNDPGFLLEVNCGG